MVCLQNGKYLSKIESGVIMKDLFDIRAYAKEKRMGERFTERIIDDIENETMTEQEFDNICFYIDCCADGEKEVEERKNLFC